MDKNDLSYRKVYKLYNNTSNTLKTLNANGQKYIEIREISVFHEINKLKFISVIHFINYHYF